MLEVGNGLKALQAVMSVREVASYIERTARWVSPDSFKLLPLWYPEHARKSHFYKENWSAQQMNTNRTTGTTIHKVEGNIYANKALTSALGMAQKDRPSWSSCHIWGVDDATYQKTNLVVMDNRFYSCVGNMVLLPTPLKAFTDTMPEVKAMLRICARNLYGWQCDHDTMIEVNTALGSWIDWQSYPESWPTKPAEKLPLGTVPLNATIINLAKKRKARIKADLQTAGQFYPRETVRAALDYWDIKL